MTSAPGRTATGIVSCRAATGPDELAVHFAIRHTVFVSEQRVFAGTDRDAHDDDPSTIHLIGRYGDEAAGVVRLFPVDPTSGLWQGDRLCVLPDFRVRGLGGPLVRCAMACAGARGGRAMVAHIQLPNVTFFRHLGWNVDGDVETYAGLPHQPMRTPLPTTAMGLRLERQFRQGTAA